MQKLPMEHDKMHDGSRITVVYLRSWSKIHHWVYLRGNDGSHAVHQKRGGKIFTIEGKSINYTEYNKIKTQIFSQHSHIFG